MKVKVFPVFHRAIDERLLFADFTADEVRTFFTPYGVNERWPSKRVVRLDGSEEWIDANGASIVLEYKLPWHDSLLQERGFMETSCYIHLLKNGIAAQYDYLGVCQYDMPWTPEAAGILRAIAGGTMGDTPVVWGVIYGSIMNAAGEMHPGTFPDRRNWAYLLESYNHFFGTDWNFSMLIDKPFTVAQSYLMPRDEFVAMASWMEAFCEEVYPWAAEPPYETHWGSIGGYSERAEAVFIAAGLAEGRFKLGHFPLGHDWSIGEKLGSSSTHYNL